MKIREKMTTALMGVLLLTALNSCAAARYLKTEEAKAEEAAGTYTLFLHGCRFSDDIMNVAILGKEGTPYIFEIYAPEFDYKIKRGIPGKEALTEGEKFVACHYSFQRSDLRKILDAGGKTIGYEVRPLYSPLDFGYSDILDVDYVIQDSKVVVRIDLKSGVKNLIFDFGRPLLLRGIRRPK